MKVLEIAYLAVAVIVTIAAIQDARTGRISNRLIFTGYVQGIIVCIFINGPGGIVNYLVRIGWPIAILYFLFLVRGLGAGDIKLFSVISGFLTGDVTISVIILSIVIGAGISCRRILKEQDIQERLYNLKDYIVSCVSQKRVSEFSTLDKESSHIHFAVCIMFGYIFTIFGRLIFEG